VDLRRLTWHEFAAIAGGALLTLGLFLPWYHAENELAHIAGTTGPGNLTAWEVHDVMRWLWLATSAAPFILAYIIVRGHKLSWARGEMTAVVAIAAFGLVGYSGLIDKPGDPAGLISLRPGYVVSLAGVILMMVGSALRASQVERARKPPGVL
jgi:hypothetical protein